MDSDYLTADLYRIGNIDLVGKKVNDAFGYRAFPVWRAVERPNVRAYATPICSTVRVEDQSAKASAALPNSSGEQYPGDYDINVEVIGHRRRSLMQVLLSAS
jgi:hypothetical protein